MNKSTKGLLLAIGTVGTVFAIAMVYLYFSPPLDPNGPAMQRFEENQRIKGVVLRWDSLDAGTRKNALPDLVRAWQLNDDDVRASATIALGNAGPDALPLLRSAVKSKDDEIRGYAVWALGIMGSPAHPALDSVRECLKDKSPRVRNIAIFAVRRVAAQPEEAVPVIAPLLADSDPEVRETAGQTLASFGKPAVSELRSMLKLDALDVRKLAVATLGMIGPDAVDAVPDLVAMLRDPQSELHGDALDSLASIGAPAVPALTAAVKQEEDPSLRKQSILALGRVGKPAIPVLGGALTDKDPSVRLQAVTALGQTGPDAVATIAKAFGDEDAEVRQEAARVLGTMSKNDPGVVPALVKALRDPAAPVRNQATLSLQAIRPDAETVLNELIPLLEDKTLDIRLVAIRFLGEFGVPAVPKLVGLLKDPEPAVWREASSTLEKLPAPEKVLFPALVPLVTDENVSARQNAVNILWRCGPPAMPLLLEALKDKAPTVRLAAVRSLDKVTADSKVVFPALVQALDDEHPAVRGSAASTLGRFGTAALPSLNVALKDKDSGVRQYAVLSLAQLASAPKDVLPLLEAARKDENAKVRQSAAQSLKSFGLPAVPLLIEMLADTDADVWKKAVESLKEMRARTQGMVKLLAAAIKDEKFAVRRGAAYVLSRFEEEGVPALTEALRDPDPRVRWEAADSLRVVGPVGDKAIPALANLAVNDDTEKVRQIALKAMLWMHGLERFTEDPSKSVPSLVASLQMKDAINRYYAALILGAIGPSARDATAALTQAAADKDQRVQQAAAAALNRVK
jgi:HEAT repeat protein